MPAPAGYKPSPLGYGSPRSSPFRRPESPSLSSPAGSRQTTPTPSPTKNSARLFTPSRFANPPSPTATRDRVDSDSRTFVRGFSASDSMMTPQPLGSPAPLSPRATAATPFQNQSIGHGSALSQLQPSQVRVLRDGFQVMDRDGDGVVNREDVVDMLTQLGLPAPSSELSRFFPPGGPQTLTLAVFLNSIAASLAALSPASELLSAFSAFDDDDSGQVDVAELRDALLHTAPEPGERAPTPAEVDKIIAAGFSGRRAFSKTSMGVGAQRRGEVFRYQEFVNSIVGGNGSGGGSSSTSGSGENSSENSEE
ncbi:EF-hand [Nemania sp. FL0916]|nr:EF-hand [Nemania sp. FL0916]